MSSVRGPRGASVRLGAHTFGLAWEADAADAIARLADEGFTRFQLMAIPPHLDVRDADRATIDRIRAAVASAGGEILSVDLPSTDVNAGSTTREVVDLTVALYVATLELAAALGSRWVTLLAGRRHALLPPPDDRLLSIVTHAFDRLVPVAESRGVRLLLENHPQSLTPTAADVASFLGAQGYAVVDALYDVANGAAVDEDPASGLSTLAPHLGLVHLSDAAAGAWRHDRVGSGDVDFAAIRGALEACSFDGPAVIEVVSDRAVADLVASRRFLEEQGWTFA
jgi:deoxyribonuclease-4